MFGGTPWLTASWRRRSTMRPSSSGWPGSTSCSARLEQMPGADRRQLGPGGGAGADRGVRRGAGRVAGRGPARRAARRVHRRRAAAATCWCCTASTRPGRRDRVARALDAGAARSCASHGGDVELAGVAGRGRPGPAVTGHCGGCGVRRRRRGGGPGRGAGRGARAGRGSRRSPAPRAARPALVIPVEALAAPAGAAPGMTLRPRRPGRADPPGRSRRRSRRGALRPVRVSGAGGAPAPARPAGRRAAVRLPGLHAALRSRGGRPRPLPAGPPRRGPGCRRLDADGTRRAGRAGVLRPAGRTARSLGALPQPARAPPGGTSTRRLARRCGSAVRRSRELRPGVEALLVNTARGAERALDRAGRRLLRLVALIRQHWTGLSGGRRRVAGGRRVLRRLPVRRTAGWSSEPGIGTGYRNRTAQRRRTRWPRSG